MHNGSPSQAPSTLEQLRAWSWQVAEQGLGPFAGAKALVASLSRGAANASAQQLQERLLRNERRKQVAAAAAVAALSTVSLPAGLPAGVAVTAVLDARLAMAVALLRGYRLDAPGVREALLDAVQQAPSSAWTRAAGSSAAAAGASLGWRAALEAVAPRALWRGRDLLLRHARGKWQRRLLPIARSLPLAGNVLLATLEARATTELAARVEMALQRLPCEATKASAIAHAEGPRAEESSKRS